MTEMTMEESGESRRKESPVTIIDDWIKRVGHDF